MKKMNRIIFCFVLIYLFSANEFNIYSSHNLDVNSDDEIKYNENNSLTFNWKKDSLGCLKLRNKELSENIIEEFKLEESDFNRFIKYFGSPNAKENKNNKLFLNYYFDSFCDKEKIIDTLDYCKAIYIFESDTLRNRHYICI